MHEIDLLSHAFFVYTVLSLSYKKFITWMEWFHSTMIEENTL